MSVSNPAVRAAGDSAASWGLSMIPVRIYEGEIVAENMLTGNHATPNYKGIPSVDYTVPPLASVGLEEDDKMKQGLQLKINKANTGEWYSSKRVSERHSGYKVIVEENTERIIGGSSLWSIF